MPQIYITFVGHSVAAAKSRDTAQRQLNEVFYSQLYNHLIDTDDRGDKTTTVKVRTVVVTLEE